MQSLFCLLVEFQLAASEKYEALAKRFPELEDKIEVLQAENTAQSKALR